VSVAAPPPAAPPVDTSNMTNDQIFHQQVPDIYYDYDSYSISPEGQAAITKAVAFLSANPNIRVMIGGYCDSRGSTEYNLALGASRADAAKDALVRGGVNSSRIRTVSWGKEKPFCTEENEQCWQQNRRAAFSVDK
jgi:peptidoglycan-associated lipoprotein